MLRQEPDFLNRTRETIRKQVAQLGHIGQLKKKKVNRHYMDYLHYYSVTSRLTRAILLFQT